VLPYIIDEKDTIIKWLSTQSNVLKRYITDYNALLTNYFKVKQEKAILKTINREIKLSKRKSRKNRSLLKKGGIRSLKN
jgi:transposase